MAKKQYGFWRQPDGTRAKRREPQARIVGNDAHEPQKLLADLGKNATRDEGGQMWWGAGFEVVFTALENLVGVADDKIELNRYDTQRIVHDAIVRTARNSRYGQALKGEDVLAAVDDVAALYYRQRVADYALVTRLSIRKLPATRISVGSSQVTGLKGRNRYPLPDEIRLDSDQFSEVETHQLVRISTAGRSEFEATEKAIHNVTLLRALWTLASGAGAWRISFGASRKPNPMAVVHTGGLYTLHHPRGQLATQMLWFDATPPETSHVFSPRVGWPKIEQRRRQMSRMLRRHPFRAQVESVLVRYMSALDEADYDQAFLKLWSLLEFVTSTERANYDQTEKRALWPFVDRDLTREVFRAARARRNRYVHASAAGARSEQAAYMVKRLLDPHVGLLLRNPFGVGSLAEYGEFLAQPSSVDALKKRRRHAAAALEHLKTRSNSGGRRGKG